MTGQLYAHQQRLVDAAPERVCLVWETGTGKSLASVTLAERHNSQSVLVICPKALHAKWLRDVPAHFTVVTKEQFKKHAKTMPAYGAVIVDEAHHFFGMKSALSRSLKAYLTRHNVRYRILATATPFRSSPWDAYVMGEILGYRQSYGSFKRKYFNDIRMGARFIPVPKKNYKDLLLADIKGMADIVRLDECVDVPEQTIYPIYVEKTKEQATAELALTEFMPLVRLTQEHQIAGGWNPETGVPVSTNKLPALMGILEANKRVIVVCKYRKEMELIERALSAFNVFQIHGDIKDRDAVLANARSQDNFVILANADTMEGWECPEANVMVFYSYSWKLVSYIQALGRIQRINAVKKNVYISLVVTGSVDEHVYNAIMDKRDFQHDLYNQSI